LIGALKLIRIDSTGRNRPSSQDWLRARATCWPDADDHAGYRLRLARTVNSSAVTSGCTSWSCADAFVQENCHVQCLIWCWYPGCCCLTSRRPALLSHLLRGAAPRCVTTRLWPSFEGQNSCPKS